MTFPAEKKNWKTGQMFKNRKIKERLLISSKPINIGLTDGGVKWNISKR